MALNPNIALQVQGIDSATPLRQLSQDLRQADIDAQNQELRDLQIIQQRYANLDAREQGRINSVARMAAQIQPLLESGDKEGALNALKSRRKVLTEAMSQGLNVDTAETDRLIGMLQAEDLDQAKRMINDQVRFSQAIGILETPQAQTTANMRDFMFAQENPQFKDFLGKQGARQLSGTEAIIQQLRAEDPSLTYAQGLALAQGLARKGLSFEDGTVVPVEGVGDALGDIRGREKRGEVIGKALGDEEVVLADIEAMQPKLETLVDRLDVLAETATYTQAGQAFATAQREAGREVSQADIDRAKYIAIVDNEILPLLRQTFGAQFTQAEGESLKRTLGDPNKTPAEKRAVLDAFITNKRSQIDVQRRKVESLGGEGNQSSQVERLRFNPETGDFE